VTQYASEGLVASILYGGHDRTDDPRWRESGAPDLAAYEQWTVRWCGIACLRMALLARDGAAPALHDLAVGAKAYGAYSDEPGQPEGLIYRPFVEYLQAQHSLRAEVATGLTVLGLCQAVRDGSFVIASVHPEIRRPHRPSPGRGGHLVLATAAKGDTVTYNDPSGHRPEALVATLPAAVFDRFFARRGIILHDVTTPDPA
jgi:hypothetical protein